MTNSEEKHVTLRSGSSDNYWKLNKKNTSWSPNSYINNGITFILHAHKKKHVGKKHTTRCRTGLETQKFIINLGTCSKTISHQSNQPYLKTPEKKKINSALFSACNVTFITCQSPNALYCCSFASCPSPVFPEKNTKTKNQIMVLFCIALNAYEPINIC